MYACEYTYTTHVCTHTDAHVHTSKNTHISMHIFTHVQKYIRTESHSNIQIREHTFMTSTLLTPSGGCNVKVVVVGWGGGV